MSDGFDKCQTPGCDGDARYAAPGRSHITGCTHPLYADRDDLAAILAKHRLLFLDEWADKCSCGWADSEADDNPAYLASHRAHVAQMVLESDWLRQRDFAKWAEGHRAPRRMTMDITDGNPYRADRVDAEDGEN